MRTYYTKHAKERMKFRIISEAEIKKAIEQGEQVARKDHKKEVVHDKVRVVYAVQKGAVVVVTVIASKAFDKQVKKEAKKQKMSHRQVIKMMKGVA